MNSGMISVRYARALFAYALDKKEEDTVFHQMQSLISTFGDMPDLKIAINSPVIDSHDKFSLIKNVVGNDAGLVFERFLRLVLDRNRENHLYRIALSYLDLYRKHKNIAAARLVTANAFDQSVIVKIKELVKKMKFGSDVQLENQINPDIGGGFVLYVDTYCLDASTVTQLKNIKKQLLDKNKKIA